MWSAASRSRTKAFPLFLRYVFSDLTRNTKASIGQTHDKEFGDCSKARSINHKYVVLLGNDPYCDFLKASFRWKAIHIYNDMGTGSLESLLHRGIDRPCSSTESAPSFENRRNSNALHFALDVSMHQRFFINISRYCSYDIR